MLLHTYTVIFMYWPWNYSNIRKEVENGKVNPHSCCELSNYLTLSSPTFTLLDLKKKFSQLYGIVNSKIKVPPNFMTSEMHSLQAFSMFCDVAGWEWLLSPSPIKTDLIHACFFLMDQSSPDTKYEWGFQNVRTAMFRLEHEDCSLMIRMEMSTDFHWKHLYLNRITFNSESIKYLDLWC